MGYIAVWYNWPMRAVVLERLGEPDELKLVELPDPEPGPGQVRVRLAAAALNHRDVWIRRGQYAKIRLPAILGSDGAGTVDAVGTGVDAAWRGREVVICPSLDWGSNPRVQDVRSYRILGMPDPGTYAEYVCVPAANVVLKPPHLTMVQAAALPLAGLTAWRAVVTQGQLRPGQRVLVTGIGGGVAAQALIWAASRGGQVWVTSSSPDKIARAVQLGALGGVDYREPDWTQTLIQAAGGEFDLIVDGTVGKTMADLVRVADYGGRIVLYGATLGAAGGFDSARVFWRQLTIQGSTMGTPDEFRAMVDWTSERGLVPVVDEVYGLEDVARAHARMEAGAQMGKIVLAIA